MLPFITTYKSVQVSQVQELLIGSVRFDKSAPFCPPPRSQNDQKQAYATLMSGEGRGEAGRGGGEAGGGVTSVQGEVLAP